MKQLKSLQKCYEILQIEVDTNFDEIKKAYLKLAKQYHPDKFKDEKKKNEAEQKFKVIKEAYDTLVKYHQENENFIQNDWYQDEEVYNDNFSNFFKQEQNNEAEIKFNKVREKNVSEFEAYIKKHKISKYDVYMAVYNNRTIYKDVLGYKAQEMLIKENLYHTFIKSDPDYIKFKMNYSMVKNLDVVIELKYKKNKYDSKQLSFDLNYQQKNICNYCNGWGCNRCDHGIIIKNKKLNIKIPKCSNNKEIIIKDKGHQSPWKNGNIVIKLIAKDNIKKHGKYIDFEYNTKNNLSYSKITQPIINSYEYLSQILINTFNFLKLHKTHTLYLSAIILLLIIIIVLACVL